MKRLFFAVLLLSFSAGAGAADIELILGVHAGYIPELGQSLATSAQRDLLSNSSGIYGINRSAPGIKTSKIEPLLARQAGLEADLIFLQTIRLGLSVNGAWSTYGGTGWTIDPAGNRMKALYTMKLIDLPVTAGISLITGSMSRISLCGGLAFNYGIYENSFKSDTIDSSGSFSGWALPLVIVLKGEFFLNDMISLSSALSGYRGFTEPIKSGDDYAGIDFSGIRWEFGLSLRISLNTEIKGV